jgi:hypothetical protein
MFVDDDSASGAANRCPGARVCDPQQCPNTGRIDLSEYSLAGRVAAGRRPALQSFIQKSGPEKGLATVVMGFMLTFPP